MITKKTYSEMATLSTFEERFRYLKLEGSVGVATFGHHRFINQMLYDSYEWQAARREAIVRDNGCDLGIEGREIHGTIVVHHINPITEDDIVDRNPIVFDLENLVTTVHNTHMAIHYSDEKILVSDFKPRTPGDTTLW